MGAGRGGVGVVFWVNHQDFIGGDEGAGGDGFSDGGGEEVGDGGGFYNMLLEVGDG